MESRLNLIALGLGLLLERFLTHLFHLREPRWLDAYFDWGFDRLREHRGIVCFLIASILVLIPVLPVAAVAIAFRDVLAGVPYLAFAVFALLFSLGPRDLSAEVDDYVVAVTRDDDEQASRLAKELIETDPPAAGRVRARAVEEAIFIQACNRLFGVILWFLLLGPTGAWLFRVTDLMRRRAIFQAGREAHADPTVPPPCLNTVQRLHGVIAWLPSRVVALGYALAGSFEGAVADWRAYYGDCSEHFFEVNDDVVACAGKGALGNPVAVAELGMKPEAYVARAAMRLVNRTLWIWLTIISLLVIGGWTV